MIETIISSGRAGAERAALEVALEMGIAYGGHVPTAAAADLTDFPDLVPVPDADYGGCIEQNVKQTGGTLIITLGRPTGLADLARRMSLKHRRQLLHVDANCTDVGEAASLIRSWIEVYRILRLHVTGTDDRDADTLYAAAVHMLVLAMEGLQRAAVRPFRRTYPLAPSERPESMEAAVQRLISEMTLREKVAMANSDPEKSHRLSPVIVQSIITRFGLFGKESPLVKSCRFASREKEMGPEAAARLILHTLWRRLRDTHKIRVVK